MITKHHHAPAASARHGGRRRRPRRRGAASQSSPRASRAPGATTQPLLSMAGAPEKDDVGAATMTSGRHGPSQAKKREVTFPDGSGRTPLHLNSIRTLGIHFRCPSYRVKRPHGDARARVPRKYVSDDNSARSRSPDTPGRSPWLDSRSAPRLPSISSSSKSSSVPYHDVHGPGEQPQNRDYWTDHGRAGAMRRELFGAIRSYSKKLFGTPLSLDHPPLLLLQLASHFPHT